MSNLIEEVARRTGLEPSAAAAAVQGVIEVLAAGLESMAQGDLLAIVPGAGDRAAIARHPATIDELYRRTGQALGMRQAAALETAQVVCQVIHDRLSGEARARLARQLDPALLELMTGPATAVAAAESAHPRGGAGHTLATGRPGSERPLSESGPGSERPLSERAPGGERPLSESAPGSDHPLSESAPGSRRPLSGTKSEG